MYMQVTRTCTREWLSHKRVMNPLFVRHHEPFTEPLVGALQYFNSDFTLGEEGEGGGGGDSDPCMEAQITSGGMCPPKNLRSLRLILMPFRSQVYGPRNFAD